MSDERALREFKHWKRAKIKKDGQTEIRFSETSNNTLSMEKYESPGAIEGIRQAGKYVAKQIMFRSAQLAKRKDALGALIPELREKFPQIDGLNGGFIMSDAGLREIVDRAWAGGKLAPANLYDREIERTAKADGYPLTVDTSKTYRKKSKPITRQAKQAKRGRPRKNLK